MVWACGKNGRVPFGHTGVDGRSQRRRGTRETEVGLDGRCEGGIRQQRTVDAARKILKNGEPWYICN